MSSENLVQILKKGQYDEQHFVPIPTRLEDMPPLAPSSVRVKVKLIALTANNVSYAALGTPMKWWDNFPVPASAPAPLNDGAAYGTLPAWGYAEVLQSTAASLTPGALVYGYQPVSAAPFDMLVEPGPAGHQFTDASAHRRGQLAIYTRYVALAQRDFASLPRAAIEDLAWTAVLRPLWQSSYLLNRFVFADGTFAAVHPHAAAGSAEAAAWAPADADLSSALVVQFAASSKTAMSLAHELKASRRPGAGPLGLLAVTAQTALRVLEGTTYPTRIIPYVDVAAEATMAWIEALAPRRVVTFDYGGRPGCAAAFADALAARLPRVDRLEFVIGVQAGVKRPGALKRLSPTMTRSNPSSQRDGAIASIGQQRLVEDTEELWRRALADGDLKAGGLRIGHGLRGEDGVEGAWKRLTGGDFGSQVSMAFTL